MSKHRHFTFFPEHWKGDVALRLCSMAARGLWIDMICEMHSGLPYGHLTTSTGVPIATADQLARVVGAAPSDVRRWINELEQAQVFSRTEEGVIFSRRMVRDAESRAAWNERQVRSRSRERHADSDPPVTPPSRDSHAVVTPLSRDSHTTKGKGKGKGNTESTSGAKAPDDPPLTDFGDLEPDVRAFLECVAAENRSGKVTASRTASLRRELSEALERVGDRAAFGYGLREAIKRGVGNIRYAVKASASYTPLMAQRAPAGPSLDDPEPPTWEDDLASLDRLRA